MVQNLQVRVAAGIVPEDCIKCAAKSIGRLARAVLSCPSESPHPRTHAPRALRLLRLSLLVSNLPHMRLAQGALLAGAVNVPLLWLIASILAWLFTSAAMVQVSRALWLHDL